MNQKSKLFRNFLINNILIIAGIIMIFSGLTLQLGFHMGGPEHHAGNRHQYQARTAQYEQVRDIDTRKQLNKLTYNEWAAIHKYAIVIFSLIIIYHLYLHWKLLKIVLTKRLIRKNIQLLTLAILFLIVVVTGLTPWIIDLFGGSTISRMIFIEIHDKITLVFIVYIILHVIKRISWYSKSYLQLKELIRT